MLAPPYSFKSAIALCRESIATDAVRLRLDPNLAREILDRWEHNDEVEAMWIKIREKLRIQMLPTCFIAAVLFERGNMERLGHMLLHELADDEAKKVSLIKRHLQKRAYRAVANEATRLADLQEARDRMFSRKKETAHRQRFITFLRAFFEDACGQPFDGIVATLTEIAFGTEVSTEVVRDAARRRDRDIRPPK